MAERIVRTTVALPAVLLEAMSQAVREGKACSRNELAATALRHELMAQEDAAIDAPFMEMANDQEYQAEIKAIMDEFAGADAEAWRLAEDER
jgi:metal-responsive CopG/Arc/MetJ family transcriptional regulator